MRYSPGGIIVWPDGLDYKQRYTVWSYAPRVDPKVLTELSAAYPAEVGRYLEVVPDRERMAAYQAMAAELRAGGLRAEVFLGGGGMARQLKYADQPLRI